MSTNEAAERLRALLRSMHPAEEGSAQRYLDAALEAERRITVERIDRKVKDRGMAAATPSLDVLADETHEVRAGLMAAAGHLAKHGCNVYHEDGPCQWQRARLDEGSATPQEER